MNSESKRSLVIDLLQKNMSDAVISRTVGVNRKFIYRCKQHLTSKRGASRKPGSGRPRSIRTKPLIKAVASKIRRNPVRLMNKLAKEYKVSPTTMRRVVKEDLGHHPFKIQRRQTAPMLAWFITLGLLLPAYALAQSPGIQCFVPGECLDSQILDTVSTNSSRTCLHHCQKIQGCEWFTFYADSKICTSLSGCLDLSPKKCPGNCISGENECPEFQCGLQGRCFGALEGIRKVGSARECGTICGNRLECLWHTYNPSQASCTLTNDCPALDKSCANCEVSETQCEGQGDGQTTVLEDSAVIPPSYALMFIGKSPHVLNLTDLKPAVCQDTPRIDHGTEAERITLRWTNSLFLITVLRKSEMAYCERFDVEQREWLRAAELKWSSQHYVDGVFTRLGDGSLFFLNVLGNSSFYVNGLGVHNGPETLTFVTGSKPEGICLTTIRDNDVFISGGSSINGPSKTSLRSAKHINPKTKAVVSLPDMPQNLTNHTCSTYVTKEGPKVLIRTWWQ
eukprot:maker-scaffold172_size289735-snap-gene-1.33 protein:Tk06522 transcript:maker-scaffold172_size289735-snap-gene-1.33-mRNA-1 annotation:"similar to H28G03.4"